MNASHLKVTAYYACKCQLSLQSVQETSCVREFVHVASAMTAVHRDGLVVASNAFWPEMQPHVSRSNHFH